MGREIRRIALDFDWPLSEVWKGYRRPLEQHFPQCEPCRGTGYGREAYAIAETFYRHQAGSEYAAWHDKIGQAEVDNLLARGRLRTWENGAWIKKPLTAEQVNAANARSGFGDYNHDGINRMILIEFRCEKLGIERHCPNCRGNGDIATQAQRDAAEAWEGTDPPTGEGWQVWETVSEGSPVTPVLPTAEALVDYLCTTGDDWTRKSIAEGRNTRQLPTRAQAEAFVKAGWVPSMMAGPGGIKQDIACAEGFKR